MKSLTKLLSLMLAAAILVCVMATASITASANDWQSFFDPKTDTNFAKVGNGTAELVDFGSDGGKAIKAVCNLANTNSGYGINFKFAAGTFTEASAFRFAFSRDADVNPAKIGVALKFGDSWYGLNTSWGSPNLEIKNEITYFVVEAENSVGYIGKEGTAGIVNTDTNSNVKLTTLDFSTLTDICVQNSFKNNSHGAIGDLFYVNGIQAMIGPMPTTIPTTGPPASELTGPVFCSYKEFFYAKTEHGASNLGDIAEYKSVKDGVLNIVIPADAGMKSKQVQINFKMNNKEKAQGKTALWQAVNGSKYLCFNVRANAAKNASGKDEKLIYIFSRMCGLGGDSEYKSVNIGTEKTIMLDVSSIAEEDIATVATQNLNFTIKGSDYNQGLSYLDISISSVHVWDDGNLPTVPQTTVITTTKPVTTTKPITTTKPVTTTTPPSTTLPVTTTSPILPGTLYGDANNDRAVNAKDVLLIKQYLAKYPVTINVANSDVTLDNDVNAKDLLRLRQHLANYKVSPWD